MMKIQREHYGFMRDAIAGAISQSDLDALRQALRADSRVKDFDKRVRWDVLHRSVPSAWICDNVYKYADDSHLDTALKRIMAECFG